MKKIIFALFAVSMAFVSCKSSSGSAKGDKGNSMEQVARKPMGMWKAMEWTSSDKIENKDALYIVEVPASKNNVELNCTNYNHFWISSVNENGVNQNQKTSFKGDYFDVRCEGNKLVVAFDVNASEERSFNLTIQSGDIFSRIKFVQKAK